MNANWTSQIDTWNDLVRKGQGAQVARELHKIPAGKVPKAFLPQVANLCWRLSQASIGIQILFPDLRLKQSLGFESGAESWAEYAACLLEIGALEEAESILEKVLKNFPRAKFYLALLHFRKWNYESSLPLLKSYLKDLEPSYHRTVVEVNLASALVVTNHHTEAEQLLLDLQKNLEHQQHHQLLGNSLEISSQIHFARGDFDQAYETATKSVELLQGSRNRGWLYGKKWQWVNRLHREKRLTTELALEYEGLVALSLEMRSWETQRELELHRGLIERDEMLLNKVYYGSSSKHYKDHVHKKMSEHGIHEGIRDFFIWTHDQGTLDMTNEGSSDLLREVVNQGESLHSFLPKKLILHLFSDFYAPFRTGQLFSLLFQGEHFNPHTSPDRLFQIVRRGRDWLRDVGLPAEISSSKTGYRMTISPGGKFLISRELSDLILSHGVWDKFQLYKLLLRTSFRDGIFSAQNLTSVANCSARTSNRILQELERQNEVISLGRGKSRKFRLAS